MYHFTQVQQQETLFQLVLFRILITAASNYLVQLPFSIFNIHTIWGASTFPFILLATDLAVRIFGSRLAHRIIFWVMLPTLLLSYVSSVLFSGSNQTGWAVLSQFNSSVGRIALTSFSVYVFDQILDTFAFTRLRRLKTWWIAPAASAIFGSALDMLMLFSITFYSGSDEFMVAHWSGIALVDYLFKSIIYTLFFLPTYGVILNILTKELAALKQSDSENNTLILTQESQPHTKKAV